MKNKNTNKANTGNLRLDYSDNAHNMGLLMGLFENDKFIKEGKDYERITCQTTGLELVAVTKKGIRAVIPFLEGLKAKTEDKKSLNQLIEFFKFSEKEKDKILIFVDPVRTPEDVFKRLYS